MKATKKHLQNTRRKVGIKILRNLMKTTKKHLQNLRRKVGIKIQRNFMGTTEMHVQNIGEERKQLQMRLKD